MTEETGWRRVIIEKPFGRDYDIGAQAQQARFAQVLDEKQIYRIDHYLGKETVQNILVFRFANGIFEPIWNRRYIDHVQITVAETVGVEQRGGYYEKAGALRDMVPNHIFQLISPDGHGAAGLLRRGRGARRAGQDPASAIQPMSPRKCWSRTVRGQYGEGVVNGEEGARLPLRSRWCHPIRAPRPLSP